MQNTMQDTGPQDLVPAPTPNTGWQKEDGLLSKREKPGALVQRKVNTPLPADSHAGGLVSSVADESDRNFGRGTGTGEMAQPKSVYFSCKGPEFSSQSPH